MKTIIILLIGLSIISCGEKLEEIPDDQFIGLWELKGRRTFDGIQIRIQKNKGNLNGKIVKLNGNKLVNIFADTSDLWISEIKRSSNFEFRITEKKIAQELFSLYGISTSQEFKVQFIDVNTIGLGTDSSDPQNSTIVYKRIE